MSSSKATAQTTLALTPLDRVIDRHFPRLSKPERHDEAARRRSCSTSLARSRQGRGTGALAAAGSSQPAGRENSGKLLPRSLQA